MNAQNDEPISLGPIVDETQRVVGALRELLSKVQAADSPDESQERALRRSIRTLDGVSEIVRALCLTEEASETLYFSHRY